MTANGSALVWAQQRDADLKLFFELYAMAKKQQNAAMVALLEPPIRAAIDQLFGLRSSAEISSIQDHLEAAIAPRIDCRTLA